MELRHLRYFVAVAQERHFGRAAARLHMAQPPLSQQIRALEAEIGVELLHRTTRRVEVTPAGESFLLRVQALLAEVDDAAEEARLIAAGATGRLIISCVGSVTYSLLPRLARSLVTELPGIEFAFRGDMLVPDQVAALHSGQVDVALLRPPVWDPAIALQTLRTDVLAVAAPTGHPLARGRTLTVSDLAQVDLIVHSGQRGSAMHSLVVKLCRDAGFEPRIRHEVHETSTLITLVAGGLGVAVVPEAASALAVNGVVYRPLRGAPGIELAVGTLAERDEPHLHRATAEIVRFFRSTTAQGEPS